MVQVPTATSAIAPPLIVHGPPCPTARSTASPEVAVAETATVASPRVRFGSGSGVMVIVWLAWPTVRVPAT